MTVEDTDSGIFLKGQIEEKNLEYLVDYLISFGKEVRVLSPESLKSKYINALTDIIKEYS